MEKIQIKFTKSEYTVYHDYCQKYYQVHDTGRKQSIQACIDLVLKGILPVGNQDISQARELLSGKCDSLKREHYSSPKGDTTKAVQIRVCSDILLFLDDLEKMYNLIGKEGVAADFLMMLGTFSRVIEEDKDVRLPATYEVKSDCLNHWSSPLLLLSARDWVQIGSGDLCFVN